jgi:hypothetical protein
MANHKPPSEVLAYTPGREAPCRMTMADNAYFCIDTGGIYYDPKFLGELAAEIGPFVPVFIVAHEWAHHVQHLMRLDDTAAGLWPIQIELQADCLAGAFTRSVRDRKAVPGSAPEEALRSLLRIGDRRAWFDPNAHGRPGQRVDAFNEGLEGRACTSDQFFETIGMATAPLRQNPSPTTGSLGSRVPDQFGRFRRMDVFRRPSLMAFGAIEMIQAVYAASDGVRMTVTIAAFANADQNNAAYERMESAMKARGLKEMRRAPVLSIASKEQLGTILLMQGTTELVLWTNRQILTAIEGPREYAWDLAMRML